MSIYSNEHRGDGIPAAVQMATHADAVILAVGSDLSWAAEGHDAKNISFTDAQTALIAEVADAAKKPVIVIIMTAYIETPRNPRWYEKWSTNSKNIENYEDT